MSWSLIVACNSDAVLENNLLKSKDVEQADKIFVQRGAISAAKAYNAGIKSCKSDLMVFAHQDIYLPGGWADRMQRCLTSLTEIDPYWGVVGTYGITKTGNGAGFAFSTGLGRFVGLPFSRPIEVRTLDEIILIMRSSTKLLFDEQLPGFHLYGTDICLEAESRGLRNYVVPCFTFHNSNGIKFLPLDFWKAYLYLRRKWWHYLPIMTPCTYVTKSGIPMFRHFIEIGWNRIKGRDNVGTRVENPERFYNENIDPLLTNNVKELSFSDPEV